MPVSWKGTLIQYAGRLHRLHSAKREVRIYDYVDVQVPVLSRMFAKRLRGYRSLGYAQGRPQPVSEKSTTTSFSAATGRKLTAKTMGRSSTSGLHELTFAA